MSSRAVIAEFVDYSDPSRPRIKTDALIGIMDERDELRATIKTRELSLELQILEHEIEKNIREKAEKKLAAWEGLLKTEGIERMEDVSGRMKSLRSIAEELKRLMEWQRDRAESAERVLSIIVGSETISRAMYHELPM